MNVLQAKTLLKRYAGLDDADPLLEFLNAGRHNFEDAYYWPFLEKRTTVVTTAGSDTVALPTDLFQVKKLKDVTNKQDIDYKPQVEFYEEILDPTLAGKTFWFTLYGTTTLRLYPVPDGAYSLDLVYQAQLSDLVNDADLLDPIPSRYHMAVVYGAASVALQAESEEDRAVKAQGEFEAVVLRAISKLSVRQIGQPSRIGRDLVNEDYSYY